ncbi:MAG: MAPEG family protein [Myxococcota bacterium]
MTPMLAPNLAAYEPAILALGILCLSVLIQGFLTAPLSFLNEEQTPGMPLQGDHDLLSFRAQRAFSNSAETLPLVGFALGVALYAGVTPALVNWLTALHVLSRIAFAGIYYSGIGKVAGGPRTMAFVAAALLNIALICAALYSLLA